MMWSDFNISSFLIGRFALHFTNTFLPKPTKFLYKNNTSVIGQYFSLSHELLCNWLILLTNIEAFYSAFKKLRHTCLPFVN